jgi:sec-independent protein translocase protein TatC
MPLMQHLAELRKRLIISFASIAIGFLICYAFADKLFEILMLPWIHAMPEGQGAKLIYTAPHEAFFTYMKVAFIGGVMLAVPVIILQIWRFVAPGLYAHEKRYLLPIIFFSSVCFLAGAFFGYFVAFPAGFRFFASFATEYITPMMRTSEYLAFASRMLFGFGLAFELPVFAYFLGKVGILGPDFLKRKRKIAIVLIFIAAAGLTPGPDVMSQLLMAGPLLVLYELSVWLVYFTARKKASKELVPQEDPESAE